jgi:hypothetical protein
MHVRPFAVLDDVDSDGEAVDYHHGGHTTV